MGYSVVQTLSTLDEIQADLPLTDAHHAQVTQDREDLKAILRGEDDRMILIIGPCSAWSPQAVTEYAHKLAPLAKTVSDKWKVIMRVYTQKPRTVTGWTGPFMEPDPHAEPNVEQGIRTCRAMMLDIIGAGLGIADEILYPQLEQYLRDCLTWAAVGARSSENQEHRILCSLLDYPVGIKNPTSGDIQKGINSIRAANARHHFGVSQNGLQIHTDGNPYAHLILRGGAGKSNYDGQSIHKAITALQKDNVPNPGIIIDASHENSFNIHGQKEPARQPKVIREVMGTLREHPEMRPYVKGFMVESFLIGGKQKTSQDPAATTHGQSITDACLSWSETEELFEMLREA